MSNKPFEFHMPSMSVMSSMEMNQEFIFNANDMFEYNDETIPSLHDTSLMPSLSSQTKQTDNATSTTTREVSSTYRDFSGILAQSSSEGAASIGLLCQSFPSKLHIMCSNPELNEIIRWLPHGRGFKIMNRKEFEKVVLPRYFAQAKYSSFHRQLNGYGFRRITHNCYYHEMFLRGMPHLCQYMKRLKKEELAKRKNQSNHVVDPNFVKECNRNPMPEDLSSSSDIDDIEEPSFLSDLNYFLNGVALVSS